MGCLSAAAALQLPIRLHGILLGRPTDLLIDLPTWQALGFVVHCGDESVRFLPYGASQLRDDEIAVHSALMLLEDVAFYQQRGVSLRSLLDGEVDGRGALQDILLGTSGRVEELVVERDGELGRVPAEGATIVPTRATAA